jgi:hypothetical protein
MRKNFLIWFYTKIERLLTKGFRHYRNLAFATARSDSVVPLNAGNLDQQTDLSGDIGIIITTFEQRFDIFAIPLIESLRKSISAPIYLVINANYGGPADTNSLMRLISKISDFRDVFPIVFGNMQGCASLWNTGLAHSNCSRNFVFNDDIMVDEETIANQMQIAVEMMSDTDLLTINNSWSHYLISDKCLKDIGPFDERFLGFGEEDGDYIRRVVDFTGRGPANVLLPSFVNVIDQSADPDVATSWGKYSLFNKCLFHLRYPQTQSTSSFFSNPGLLSVPEDFDLRSIEEFKTHFYPLLVSENPKEIISALVDFYSA